MTRSWQSLKVSFILSRKKSIFRSGLSLFWSVITPLCKPVYAATALFVAAYYWNSRFDALIYNRFASGYTVLRLLKEVRELHLMQLFWLDLSGCLAVKNSDTCFFSQRAGGYNSIVLSCRSRCDEVSVPDLNFVSDQSEETAYKPGKSG